MNAIDAFAISMLAVVFAGFGVVAILFVNMARHAGKRDIQLEELMQEALEADPKSQAATPSKPAAPRDAWERDGDWWQKER